jgi:hypothetical protein
MSTCPPNAAISLPRAYRQLALAQRLIERIARQHSGNLAIQRRFDKILNFLVHLPLPEELVADHPRCSVCQSPQRGAVEAMLADGVSVRKTAARFPGLSTSAIYRHCNHPWHNPNVSSRPHPESNIATYADYVADLRGL